jgi:hypothetical protein
MSIRPFPEIKPVALVKAKDACLKLWPLDDAPPELPLTHAETLRIRALILETNPGTQLKRRDIRGTFRLCLDNTETAEWVEKAIAVLVSMPEQPGFNPLYDLYAGNYTNTALREATSTAYAKLGPDQRRVPLDRIEKVLCDDPLAALSWDTITKFRPVADTVSSCRLLKTSALSMSLFVETYNVVFDDPLRNEHAAWIRTHSAQQILELLGNQYGTSELRRRVVGAVVRAWNMLRASVPAINSHNVINTLFQRVTRDDMLGDPMERKIRWESDRELQELVRKWVLDKKIQSFFDLVDANEDRKEYWQSNVDIISDYEDLSSGRSAFAMKIGKIWFVEFGENGNACYPYSDESYRSIRRGKHVAVSWEYDPLKQINRVFLPDSTSYSSENREFKVTDRRTLIHSPKPTQSSEGWYEKFDAYITAFCDVQSE